MARSAAFSVGEAGLPAPLVLLHDHPTGEKQQRVHCIHYFTGVNSRGTASVGYVSQAWLNTIDARLEISTSRFGTQPNG